MVTKKKKDFVVPVDNTASGEPLLECRVCGDIYVHPISVVCNPPGILCGSLTIDASGIRLNPKAKPLGRGVSVLLHFQCEHGHKFCYTFRFHKGLTLIGAKHQRKSNDVPQVIWRD